jgi:predicted PurR-regulated permease PerM|tara:strand:- start:247 stop:1443 length:1197 start_codon:yes stop_codon:yes gene_type:complete
MPFPSPSDKQAKVLWFSLTALSIAVFLALLALMFYGVGWVLDRLSPVLLPLAIAGILAFLLNPLVDFFEPKMSAKVSFLFAKIRNPKRVKAILLVLMIGFCIITALTLATLTTVVPEMVKLAEETKVEYVQQNIRNWAAENKASDWGAFMQVEKLETIDLSALMIAGKKQLSALSEKGVSEAIALIGLLAGLALVPVYVFYFLLEARTIEMKWSDYLPLKESRFKEEAVFVLSSFNDCLVVFFRGQVLVAFCVGVCLAIGFSIIGLPYAILIGLAAGLLGIIPYFGVIASAIPVLLLSLAYGDQMIVDGAGAPVLALGICALVLFLEKTVIQPKIIGDRVGMHPVAVIISVLMGATLVGGVIGGLLAIPVAMALRTVLFRYVWVRRQMPEKATQMEAL